MLELAALGLLQQQPLHGYRLKQQLEQFMSGCISVNYGAIYPLLKRLEDRGDIMTQTEEASQGGPSRKIYQITSQGRDRWKQEMMAHPHESWVNARSRFCIKVFFFSHIEPAERLKLIKHRLMTCRLRLESQQAEPTPSDPYQAAIGQRFEMVLQDEIQWLVLQLQQEKLDSLDSPPQPASMSLDRFTAYSEFS
ncbi:MULTISPECIES: PadR family transcriptional regulator [Trichocoleus]|uniref:PadR family transcriptional regulator n=1 Tax=Trichocoleus desertorum GB2-A4 TaxID=2933944 RepID=A0ABV0J341_9CYAN|nr:MULTISPECIES: PadR family transcriptional regulator [unclassified Trichocoleus]MBD1860203.1 helix-turn-helix transcriptional regulator [Trichocoleus sp. FACHB-46]MBD2094650.1 helix-turn-helix transcriptional regulator [Trichocoleus sp. FACHB-591]